MSFTKHASRILLSATLALPLVAGGASLALAQSGNGAAQANGSLEQSHGQWRASKLDGATVYNEQGTSIGTVNDMLLGSDGKVSNVVISVGGFLGMGEKYVEVPFSKLKFEPSKSNPANNGTTTGSTAAGQANGHDYSVVLPDVSKESLTKMTGFTY